MRKGSFERIITVKLGGSAMDDDDVVHQLAEDVSEADPKIGFIIVHGGGKAITREMDARGIKTVKVAGLRVTDDASMSVVESVMGKTNDSICAILKEHGAKAVKIIGSDGLIESEKMPPAKAKEGGQDKTVDLGRVGSVSKINPGEIEDALAKGSIPVVSPYGRTKGGLTLNINADTAAGSIAGACSDEFILLTDVEGIIVPGTDVVNVASELTLKQIAKLIGSGVIKDGMLPKVEACEHAIKSGVKSARIVNGLGEHPLKSVLAGEEIGTLILP
jgi:acetylglutamate kinase